MDAFRFAVSGVVGVSAGHDSEGLEADFAGAPKQS